MITEEVKKMLHESIDAAKGFGACQYVANGEPQCVVAQFAYRCGVSVEEMNNWKAESGKPESWAFVPEHYSVPQQMKDISGLLQNLQNIWDDRKVAFYSESLARPAMHYYVNNL